MSAVDDVRGVEQWHNRRFEGLYGRLYNRVIQSRVLRTAAFSLWGSADPVVGLDAFVEDAVAVARASSTAPVLVDVPCGGGTLLPLLARGGFDGTVVETDLAGTMLRRAVPLHRRVTPALDATFLQSDALDLPLEDAAADVVISVNGLHVMPDHARFLRELARITRPGGTLFLITPVRSRSVRSTLVPAVARRTGIISRTPPTATQLERLLNDGGWQRFRSYGGRSITGLACVRS